jgi:hypothetical protein
MIDFFIIGEWTNDIIVVSELVRKILLQRVTVKLKPIKAGGKGKVIGKFIKWLDGVANISITKALIVVDQDDACIKHIVDIFYNKISGRKYKFEVKFHIVESEIETWLLADEKAISSAIGKGKTISKVKGNLEGIKDAKEKLQRILAENSVVYTGAIAKKIAANANLETIAQRCPGFRRFQKAVIDC